MTITYYRPLTIQEFFSSVSDKEAVDLTRVGEESLMESTQALVLAAAVPVSIFFASLGAGNGFGSADENKDLGKMTLILISIPDLASDATTFWFVISSF